MPAGLPTLAAPEKLGTCTRSHISGAASLMALIHLTCQAHQSVLLLLFEPLGPCMLASPRKAGGQPNSRQDQIMVADLGRRCPLVHRAAPSAPPRPARQAKERGSDWSNGPLGVEARPCFKTTAGFRLHNSFATWHWPRSALLSRASKARPAQNGPAAHCHLSASLLHLPTLLETRL